MARPDYDLNSARDANLVSSNGTEYEINILWTGATDTTDMVLGPSGAQISYETPEDKTKNSYISSSKCTIPFLVQNATDKAFILLLATDYQEREVWITIRESSGSGTLLWAGYVLLDLKDEQDISYPYEVTLTAIDGLAALKDKPFVRELNTETGLAPAFPYVRNDTYYNAGYQNIIGGTTTTVKWLAELLFNTGMVIADDGDGASYLTNYHIQTSVNLWNEGHPAPAEDKDPLGYSQLNMKNLYIEKEGNIVDVPTCYEVLEYICKSFGMRCCYFEHVFYFVEIDQYNQDSPAASTPSFPKNLPTTEYFYGGGYRLSQIHLGNSNFSIYDLTLENVTAPGEGLQKLSGGVYSGLPAIKTVTSTYLSSISLNAYSGFPRFPSEYGMPLDASGAEVSYSVWNGGYVIQAKAGVQTTAGVPNDIIYTTIDNFKDFDGMNFETYLSYKNTTTANLNIYTLFILIAKPTGQGAATYPFKVCARNTGSVDYTWTDWTTANTSAGPFSGTSALRRYARQVTPIPPSATIDQNVGISCYSTATDPYCVSHNGLFPTDPVFSGSWDFSVLSFMCYDSDSTYEMRGFDGFGTLNYGASYNHGCVTGYSSGTATNYAGTPLSTVGKYQKTTEYQYDYDNTLDNDSSSQYLGTLQAISSTEGVFPTSITVDVVNKNTYIFNSDKYFFSDGATIKVSADDITYVNASIDGKWTKPTYVWNNGTTQFDYTVGAYDKQLVVLDNESIIYNQSIPLKQLNGTTALSENEKHYTGTTILKYMNPIARLTDLDGNNYQLMRGTFNLLTDEWETTMNQVFYEIPSETINVGIEALGAGYLDN